MNLDFTLIKNVLWLNFDKAREFARSLGLESREEWLLYTAGSVADLPVLSSHIPAEPNKVYALHGWGGWEDWLGIDHSAKGRFCSFAQARRFARTLNLTSSRAWYKYVQANDIPKHIPRSPRNAYKEQGWSGWHDFLGTPKRYHVKHEYLDFEQARAFAQSLFLSSQAEWTAIAHDGDLPENIPCSPHYVYRKSGWISWGDWLGTNYVATQKRIYRQFDKAREFARALEIHSVKEWYKYAKGEMPELPKRPGDVPASPRNVYQKQGWVSYSDWLGL